LILMHVLCCSAEFLSRRKDTVRAESNGFKVSFGSGNMQKIDQSQQITVDQEIAKIFIPKMGFLGYLHIPPKIFPMFQLSGLSQQDSKKFAEVR